MQQVFPQNNNPCVIYSYNCVFYTNQIKTAFFTGQFGQSGYFSANQPMFQQQQMNYGGVTDMNSFGSQDNNNNRVAPHPAYIQNYVLGPLEDAITTTIRSHLSDNYSINTPEVNEYIQQVIVTVEIVFKNQVREKNNYRTCSPNVYISISYTPYNIRNILTLCGIFLGIRKLRFLLIFFNFSDKKFLLSQKS